jgi:hypothetical protein
MEGYTKIIIEIECEDMDCIRLAHDEVPWQASVNTVMNLRVPYRRIFRLAEWL